MNECPKCGAPIEAGAMLCDNCGSELRRPAPPEDRRKMPLPVLILVGMPSMAFLVYVIVILIQRIF